MKVMPKGLLATEWSVPCGQHAGQGRSLSGRY